MNRDVFPAVEPASPVHAALARLRDVVAADPALAVEEGARVRADAVTRRSGDGTATLTRFVWSVQRPAPDGTLAGARTLVHDGVTGSTATHDFPDDPVLTWLRPHGTGGTSGTGGPRAVGAWWPHEGAVDARVLRYIPLRRATVRLHGVPGLPDRVVAKTQRERDLQQADRVLTEVQRAVQHVVRRAGALPFRVPRTLGLDDARRLLYLEEVPGTPLSRSLGTLGTDEAMDRLGAVHHALHGLDVGGLTTLGAGDWLRAADRAAGQVATFLPSLAGRVSGLCARLARAAPSDGAAAFCQGDLVPSQVLCDPSGWSVIDLDDAHRADPYAEVAALWTALPRELSIKDPARADDVRERYLAAYLRGAGTGLDEQRWRWHLAVAGLRLAARRLVKGRAVPGETEAVLDALAVAAPVP